MGFLALNMLMVLAWYFFTERIKVKAFSERLLFSGLFTTAQIILTELVFGVLGLLYADMLFATNAAISLGILFFSVKGISFTAVLRRDWSIIRNGLKSVFFYENVFLSALWIFTFSWFILAAYFLPPRGGADDIFYHLASIYEFIVKHRVYLLPLYKIKYTFAFPLNAELLFMWPALLQGNQRWVDFVQVVAALGGVLAVYALARSFKHQLRDAFFLAMLFFFTPVVLNQAESNYIDIITNVSLLIMLYCALQFYRQGEAIYLYGLAVAGGLLLGMKYFFVIFWLAAQFLIFPRLLKQQKARWISYFLLTVIFCGYWYLRNAWVLGNPFYPLSPLKRNLNVFFSGAGSFNAADEIRELFYKLYALCCDDVGLGTFDGGLGLIFWGIGFPSWLWVLFRALKSFNTQKEMVFFWAQPLLGFSLILLNPPVEMQWVVRWAIYIAAIGLLAAGEALRYLKNNKPAVHYIKIFSLVSSLLSVTLLSRSVLPNYRLHSVLKDRLSGNSPSEFKYYKDSSWYLPHMRFVAEPLDFLTREDPEGMVCYMAAEASSFWVTNIYGSKFQNRVWNLEKNPDSKPDAYVFQNFAGDKTAYIGGAITLREIMEDPDYFLVAVTPYTSFFIREDALKEYNRWKLLIEYYQTTFPDLLAAFKNITAVLDPSIPVVVEGDIGYALQYLRLKEELKNRFYWAPEGLGWLMQGIERENTAYTFEYSLKGLRSEKIYTFKVNDTEIPLFINWREDAPKPGI